MKKLNSNHLKLIAIIAMTIDHIADLIYPGMPNNIISNILHIIGRLTAPIMFFFICEGFYYTKNLKKYILANDERIAKLINEYQKWKNDMTLVNVAILDIVYASTTMPKSLEENIEDINNMIDQGYLTAEQVSVTKRVGGKLLDVSFTSLEDFKYSSGIGTTVVLESVK